MPGSIHYPKSRLCKLICVLLVGLLIGRLQSVIKNINSKEI